MPQHDILENNRGGFCRILIVIANRIRKLLPIKLRRVLNFLYTRVVVLNPLRTLHKALTSPNFLGERYTMEDNTQVLLVTDQPGLFPGYCPVQTLTGSPRKRQVTISLVATARNERHTAQALIDSILTQTRLPDEIVAIDTGSTDGTLELFRGFAAKSPVPFRVLEEKGANIARGRNLAIAQARSEVIAVTDFGCKPQPDWLENLIAPFEIDPDIQVSGGRYQAVDSAGNPVRWLLGRTLQEIEPQSHLPSSVSIAFTKQAWELAGGYPEWLSLTGEDTYFDLELKRTTTRWAFVPEAVVEWEAPQRLAEYWLKAYRWSIGDGESGTTARAYRSLFLQLGSLALGLFVLLGLGALAVLSRSPLLIALASLAALVGAVWFLVRLRKSHLTLTGLLLRLGTNIGQVLGFVKGLSHRPQVDRRREAGLQGTFILLAGVPIDDTGGGARWTQIALELIRRHYLVVFIHKFPKYERVDLRLSIRHPNLVSAALANFRWRSFAKKHAPLLKDRPLTALVELPLGEFLPIISEIRKLDGAVIYDLLDNWSTSLGGEWYSEAVEKEVIQASQVLVSTVPPLQERLARVSGREVSLVPNAVNSLLFDPSPHYPLPSDMPAGVWRAVYVGALWGEWFNWDLLVQVARAYPHAAVVVIGDYAGQCSNPPPNLHFLGLKPQRSLPAYLTHADVAIIPWKVTPITQTTSPLKVYEYIAMRKPVVAPGIRPLQGLPGVIFAEDAQDFVAKVGRMAHAQVPAEEAARFVQENNWQARVDILLDLARSTQEATYGKPVP